MSLVMTKIIVGASLAAVSLLSRILLQPKSAKTVLDTNKNEPSERGSLLGVLSGHFIVGPVIGYVGARWSKKQKVGTGGKGGGSASSSSSDAITYFEEGWHILNMGQGKSLKKIIQNGKVIWSDKGIPVTPATHTSGTAIDISTEDIFKIYWGESNQPVNTTLSTRLGAYSRWPNVMYIYWTTKRLGPSPVWPALEYEISVEPKSPSNFTEGPYMTYSNAGYTDIAYATYTTVIKNGVSNTNVRIKEWNYMRVNGESTLLSLQPGHSLTTRGITTNVASIVRSGGYTYIRTTDALPVASFDDSSGWVIGGNRFSSAAYPFEGANPAYIIAQMLFQPRPLGAGLSTEWFDMTSLQAISTLAATEETPTSVYLRSGKAWKDGIVSLMTDLGLLFVFNTTTGKYEIKAIRDTDARTEIDAGLYNADDWTETSAYSVLSAESSIFTYKDSSRDFADSTIPMNDDGQSKYGADPNVKAVPMETITSFIPASKVAVRRKSEASETSTSSLEVSHLVNPQVGTPVTLENFPDVFRVVSVGTNPDESKRTLGLLKDSYVSSSEYEQFQIQGMGMSDRITVLPDVIFTAFEITRLMSTTRQAYFMLRIKGSPVGEMADVWHSASTSASTFQSPGVSASCTGGSLVDAMVATTSGIIEDGPEVALIGDEYDFLDLSSQPENWYAGTQLCIIGGEMFYLRNVTFTSAAGESPVRIRLHGLVRARKATPKQAHPALSTVYILPYSELQVFDVPLTSKNAAASTIYTKTTPYSWYEKSSIDLSLRNALTYTGGSTKPITPVNLGTDNGCRAWRTGTAMTIRWDHINAVMMSGAGLSAAGDAYIAPAAEGNFQLKLKRGSTVVVTITTTNSSYTFTSSAAASYFSTATYLTAELTQTSGKVSNVVTARIDKV